MSLGFKRVMSSIMAFVMMVSTHVMVNVASVSAATYTITGNEFNPTTDTNTYKNGDNFIGKFSFTITDDEDENGFGLYTQSVKVNGGRVLRALLLQQLVPVQN